MKLRIMTETNYGRKNVVNIIQFRVHCAPQHHLANQWALLIIMSYKLSNSGWRLGAHFEEKNNYSTFSNILIVLCNVCSFLTTREANKYASWKKEIERRYSDGTQYGVTGNKDCFRFKIHRKNLHDDLVLLSAAFDDISETAGGCDRSFSLSVSSCEVSEAQGSGTFF